MYEIIKKYMLSYKNIVCARPKIGLLSTNFNYKRENKKKNTRQYPISRLVYEAFEGHGLDIHIIDYNNLLTAETVDMEFFHESSADKQMLIDQVTLDIVQNYLMQHKIKKVIIPGYFYNWQHEPRPLTPNREWFTRALTKLAEEKEIHLLGMCGGMQGIVHARGIKLAKVSELVGRDHSAHHIGFLEDIKSNRVPDINKSFNESFVKPDTYLAEIAKQCSHIRNDNNWLGVKVFELHEIAIDNDPIIVKKLEDIGYNVIMKSNDGIIEGIEDGCGNMHFQFHPDYALYYGKCMNKMSLGQCIDDAYKFAKALINDFINRPF